MKLERLRIATEIVGIVAVVSSVLILVAELNQTQDAIQASTYDRKASGQMAFNIELFESTEMLPLLAMLQTSGREAIEALPPVDQLRLRVFFTAVRVDLDNEHYQYERGLLDDEHVEHVLKPNVRSNAPLWRAFGVDDGRPAFRAFVEATLAE